MNTEELKRYLQEHRTKIDCILDRIRFAIKLIDNFPTWKNRIIIRFDNDFVVDIYYGNISLYHREFGFTTQGPIIDDESYKTHPIIKEIFEDLSVFPHWSQIDYSRISG